MGLPPHTLLGALPQTPQGISSLDPSSLRGGFKLLCGLFFFGASRLGTLAMPPSRLARRAQIGYNNKKAPRSARLAEILRKILKSVKCLGVFCVYTVERFQKPSCPNDTTGSPA